MTLDQIIHNSCALEVAVIAAIGLTALALAHLLGADATQPKHVRNTKLQIVISSLRDARASLEEAKAAKVIPVPPGAKPDKMLLECFELAIGLGSLLTDLEDKARFARLHSFKRRPTIDDLPSARGLPS